MEGGVTYELEGKSYVRMGECNRCGMCCTGFKEPCPYLHWVNADHCECLVYDRRDDPSLQETSPANPLGCIAFPDGPQSQSHPSIKNKCGFYFVRIEKVLVACPTYDGKEYCFEEYLRAYESLDWPAKELLVVDTSDKEGFYQRWKDKARMKRIDVAGEEENRKIALGMERIREYFLQSDCERWLNIEADIIVPPETIEVLLSIDLGRGLNWVSHTYPPRSGTGVPTSGFGIGLFSKRMIREHGFNDAPAVNTTDGWYWNKVQRSHRVIEIWNILDVKHRG